MVGSDRQPLGTVDGAVEAHTALCASDGAVGVGQGDRIAEVDRVSCGHVRVQRGRSVADDLNRAQGVVRIRVEHNIRSSAVGIECEHSGGNTCADDHVIVAATVVGICGQGDGATCADGLGHVDILAGADGEVDDAVDAVEIGRAGRGAVVVGVGADRE